MTYIRKITIVLGALCLVAMACVTCAEVFMRYFMRSPIFGAAELTQLLLGILVFSGMFAVTRDRGHVNVSLFEPFLLRHVRRAYRRLFDICTLVGVLAIAVILGWRVWDLTHYPESTVVLRFPMIWIVGVMTLLAGLAVVAAIAAMRDTSRETPPHSPQNFE
ncbi:TRAP transporter small permease [Microbulbifer sp. S227A]|uniref:TRAP transporter small permease n=1 Tax=Microbulbifer sp. S227A TaxID=3415131 RepID=UPI003C7D54E3